MAGSERCRAAARCMVVTGLAVMVGVGCSTARRPGTARPGAVVAKLHPVTARGVETLDVGTVTLIPASERSVGVSILVARLLTGEHYIEFHQGGTCAPA